MSNHRESGPLKRNRVRDSKIDPIWWAPTLFILIGGLIALTAGAFSGKFQDFVPLTLVSNRAGLVMEDGAKVAGARQWEERIAVAQTSGMAALEDSTLARWFPPETHAARPPHLDKVRAMIRTTPVNGFIGGSAALADHDYNTAVATVTRPVLFIAGSKDGVTPAAMKDMHARLKGSRYVELEGAGHISNLDRPVEFTTALREFLGA